MKIIVLNGSPKGDMSATLQYVHFIQKKFPQHELKIFNVAQQIRGMEREEKAFQEVMEEIKSSDGVLWAFPLYYLLVPSQYKRFIELIWERATADVLKNKYTAALSTSVHFFDHTAHNYMNAICDDLDMKYLGFFSAAMYDLMHGKERERCTLFASEFFEGIRTHAPTAKKFAPVSGRAFDYSPGPVGQKVRIGGKKVLILADLKDPNTNLSKMIERFRNSFAEEVSVADLRQLDIKGGCLGCIQCGYDYQCSYGDRDEFVRFYKDRVKAADILIFAGTIQDRYLSSRWKMFFDRSFFHTHTPSLTGKQVGFIVSGPLRQIPNLRQILEAYTEWQQANLVDIVTDELDDAKELDARLQSLAERVVHLAGKSYIKTKTFLSVGGMKVLRDDVWGKLRFPFQADHRFYRTHGLYDFPQRKYKSRLINSILILLTKIPSMRKEIYHKKMKEQMVKPLQKIVETMGQLSRETKEGTDEIRRS
jgi:multimeric flavodoxin WrbA